MYMFLTIIMTSIGVMGELETQTTTVLDLDQSSTLMICSAKAVAFLQGFGEL